MREREMLEGRKPVRKRKRFGKCLREEMAEGLDQLCKIHNIPCSRYARLLCHHPYAVLSSVVVVVVTCLVLSLTARPLPSFEDPSLVCPTLRPDPLSRRILLSCLFVRMINVFFSLRVCMYQSLQYSVSELVFLEICIIMLPHLRSPRKGFEARGTEISQRATAWENLLDATRASGLLSVNPADDPALSRLLPHITQEGDDNPDKDNGEKKSHKHQVSSRFRVGKYWDFVCVLSVFVI